MQALSMYDVQCSDCKEWKHYKDEFQWSKGKRGQKCNDCRGKAPQEPIEEKPTTRRRGGKPKQSAPHRRVKNINALLRPDPVLEHFDLIVDGEYDVESPIAWYGQKRSIIDWILRILDWPEKPNHLFVDGCGGSATVLLDRPQSTAEIYNDRDGMLVNFFRINRDWPLDLMCRLYLTPWSRDEFMAAASRIVEWRNMEQKDRDALLMPLDANPLPGNVEMAIADAVLWSQSVGLASDFFTFINQGHSHKAKHVSWSMEYGIRNRKPDWWDNKVGLIGEAAQRLSGVAIENTNVVELIGKVNSEDTLLYLDPPYLLETRREGAAQSQYYYEMGEQDHRDMAEVLEDFKGRVAIAGYRSHLYDDVLFPESKGWMCFLKGARASDTKNSNGERTRVEAMWTNYEPSGFMQLPGFEGD